MTAQPKPTPKTMPEETGRALALQAAHEELTKAKGDVRRGAERFAKRVRGTPSLRDALLEPLIETACYQMLAQMHAQARKLVWTAPPPETTGGRLVNLAHSLLDFPLPGGTRLARASRAEVLAGAELYRKRAKDEGHKARWLARVAEGMDETQTAGEAFDEPTLRRLQKEAEDG
jgi:hypothetical protein